MTNPRSVANQSGGTFFNEPSPADDGPRAFFDPKDSDSDLPIQGTTGPVGEPGLPPARPVSTHYRERDIKKTASRPSTASPRMGSQAPGGDHWADLSRPGTSNSRSHVANMTPSTFFRPMSSRHLREENIRSMSPGLYDRQPPPRVSEENTRVRREPRSRHSDASIVTMDQGQRPLIDEDAPPIPKSPLVAGPATPDTSDQYGRRNLHNQGSSVPLRPTPISRGNDARVNGAETIGEKNKPVHRSSFGWTSFRSNRTNGLSDHGQQRLESGPYSPNVTSEKKSATSQHGRNYEYYNGNSVFFFDGRLMNTKQNPLNAATGFLATLPALLFFIFSASWSWHNISPAIPIIFAYITFICISAFFHASFSDPGVLPRNLHPHPPDASDEDPLSLGPSQSDWVMVKSWPVHASDPAHTAMEVPVKYCKSCNIWRPPRAHHCRICDACTETQDHHCVWLNNCVGRRNYRYFFTFISFGSILSLFLFGISLAHILVYANRNGQTMREAISGDWTRRGALAMVIYAVLISPYPLSLTGYHIFLVARGETTREYLNSHKFLKKDRHRPFDQHSWLGNMAAVFFRPRPSTYLQFKAPYSLGDMRMGSTTRRKGEPGSTSNVEMKNLEAEKRGATNGVGQSSAARNSTPR